jgi:hypothetical protein
VSDQPPEFSAEETSSETPAERQARLRAELIERAAIEKCEAFRAELRGYTPAAGAAAARAHGLNEFFEAIKAALPELVTVIRREPSDRDCVVIARGWWRSLRQTMADRFTAEAEATPELIPWRDLGEGE